LDLKTLFLAVAWFKGGAWRRLAAATAVDEATQQVGEAAAGCAGIGRHRRRRRRHRMINSLQGSERRERQAGREKTTPQSLKGERERERI